MSSPILLAVVFGIFFPFFSSSIQADDDYALTQYGPKAASHVPSTPLDFAPGMIGDGSTSGDFSHRVELKILPAVNNMAPDLALVYSKSIPNGPLGAGWLLSFESSIERRSRLRGTPRFEDDDLFFLDGSELVPLSDNTYRTLQTDYTVISKIEDDKARIIGWTAKKDGFTRTYGDKSHYKATEYQDEDSQSKLANRWLLSRVQDVFGNSYTINYTIPEGSYRHLPKNIKYNKSSDEDYHLVEFEYESREDVRMSYRGGLGRLESQLLTGIKVSAFRAGDRYNSQYYSLEYSQPTHDVQSLLARVLRVAIAPSSRTRGESILLRAFEYEDSGTSWNGGTDGERIEVSGAEMYPNYSFGEIDEDNTYTIIPILADIDADSRPDLIVLNDPCQWREKFVPENPIVDLGKKHNDIELARYEYKCDTEHRVFLNRLQTAVSVGSGSAGQMTSLGTSYTKPSFVFDEDRSQDLFDFLGSMHDRVDGVRRTFQVIDLNRDGYVDLLRGVSEYDTTDGAIALGDSHGWTEVESEVTWLSELGDELFERYHFVDLNADGLPDLVGQTDAFINRGWEIGGSIEFFDLKDTVQIADPYLAAPELCDGEAPSGILRFDLAEIGGEYPSDLTEYHSEFEDWVWRNTTHADVNGDGLIDRIVAFRHLAKENPPPLWGTTLDYDYPDPCPPVSEVYYGNGGGVFSPADYGVGYPTGKHALSEGTKLIATRDDIDDTPKTARMEFSFAAQYMSFVDVNSNGRPELTQLYLKDGNPADADASAVTYAFSNHGMTAVWSSVGKSRPLSGFRLTDTSSSMNELKVAVPVSTFGIHPTEEDYRTLVDLNGDGMVDGFRTATFKAWAGQPVDPDSALPRWYRNSRTTAQNRLIKVTGPHGGATIITWNWSAEGESDVPLNIEVVESIRNEKGTHLYQFSGAGYGDNQFQGFSRVELNRPGGARTVREFHTSVSLKGKEKSRQIYGKDGELHKLRLFKYGRNHRGILWAQSASPPYFDPVCRICDFEIDPSIRSLPDPEEISTYERLCNDFVDEEGAYDDPDVGWSTQYSEIPPEAADLDGLSPSITISEGNGSSTTESKDLNIIGSEMDVLVEDGPIATEHVTAPPSGLRMEVTDFSYDFSTGSPTLVRDLGDIAHVVDSQISAFEYHDYDQDYAGVLLKSSAMYGRSEIAVTEVTRYEQIVYPSGQYVGDRWGKRIETPFGDALDERALLRGIDLETGNVEWTEDARGNSTQFGYTAAGLTESEEDALGNKWTWTYDETSRLTRSRDSYGFKEETDYDDLGRITERRIFAGSPDPPQVTKYEYVWGATDGPHKTIFREESNGAESRVEKHVDEYGRSLKTVRRHGAAAITEETDYHATGEVKSRIGPYDDTEGRGAAPKESYEYDEFGRITSKTLPDHETLAYGYGLGWSSTTDPLGIESKTAVDGTVEEYTTNKIFRGAIVRNAIDDVVQSIDAARETVSTAYDGFNRVQTATLPLISVFPSGATATKNVTPQTKYAYYANDWLRSETDPNGNKTVFSYDLIGRRTMTVYASLGDTSQTLFFDKKYPDRLTQSIDEAGNIRSQYLDGQDREWKTVATDGAETSYEYDLRGRLARQTLPWGEIRLFEYDHEGNRVRQESIRGNISAASSIEHDARSLVVRTIDADGVVSRQTYDAVGRPLSSELGESDDPSSKIASRFVYDSSGRLVEQEQNGVVSRFTLDALGRIIEEQTAYDSQTNSSLLRSRRSYSETDELLTDTLGNSIRVMAYDAVGRLVSEERRKLSGESIGSRSLDYDATGNMTRIVDERGIATKTKFDERNRIVSVRQDGLGATRYSYQKSPEHPLTGVKTNSLLTVVTSPTNESTNSYVDGEGRLWLTQTPVGSIIENVYAESRLVVSRRYTSDGSFHSLRRSDYYPDSDYLHHDWDWMTEETDSRCLSDPNCGLVGATIRTYSPGGRPENLTNGAGSSVSYTYTPGTGLSESTSADGLFTIFNQYEGNSPLLTRSVLNPDDNPITTEYVYENNYRFQEIRRQSPSQQEERAIFDYDAAGNQTLIQHYVGGEVDPETQITKAYDEYGRILDKTYLIDGTSYAPMKWRYHPNGLLRSQTYPSGNSLKYRYKANTNLLHSATSAGKTVARFAHDASGRVTNIAVAPDSPGEVSMTRAFSVTGLEESRDISGVSASGTRIEKFEYDGLGHLDSIHVVDSGINYATRFQYNEKDYLIGELHAVDGRDEHAKNYTYDPVSGVRTDLTSINGSGAPESVVYAYSLGNRLTSVDGTSVSWDEYGRQQQDARGNSYSYTLEGRVQGITDSNGLTQDLVVDGEGQCVSRTSDGATEIHLAGTSSGEVMHAELSSGQTRDFVRGPSGSVIAWLDQNGRITPVIESITGSPCLFGSSAGGVSEVRYDGFGGVLEIVGNSKTDLGFHGMWATDTDEIMLAGVRAYDRASGRFLTTDPLFTSSSTDPNDASDLFRYAQNDPIQLADASGLAPRMFSAPAVSRESQYMRGSVREMDRVRNARHDERQRGKATVEEIQRGEFFALEGGHADPPSQHWDNRKSKHKSDDVSVRLEEVEEEEVADAEDVSDDGDASSDVMENVDGSLLAVAGDALGEADPTEGLLASTGNVPAVSVGNDQLEDRLTLALVTKSYDQDLAKAGNLHRGTPRALRSLTENEILRILMKKQVALRMPLLEEHAIAKGLNLGPVREYFYSGTSTAERKATIADIVGQHNIDQSDAGLSTTEIIRGFGTTGGVTDTKMYHFYKSHTQHAMMFASPSMLNRVGLGEYAERVATINAGLVDSYNDVADGWGLWGGNVWEPAP